MQLLRITSKTHGFVRAGIRHPGTPVDHRRDDLTERQIRLLLAEPELVVQELDLPDDQKGKRADKGTPAV